MPKECEREVSIKPRSSRKRYRNRFSYPLMKLAWCESLRRKNTGLGWMRKGGETRLPGRLRFATRRLIQNEDILLVDDVFTTGATVSACAEALMTAGARSVFVLTLARA